ncbi:DUF5825 family protein [Streptomyces sp. cg28]|uniref:DUF5825 family protein n=1 Tax=Streptomyces sp. cg28 TaxID=3403457 RepID=UPI003B20B602
MTTTLTTPTVHAWRDYDLEACALPGMSLGEVALPGPARGQAARLWGLGARRVHLPVPVDLTDGADPATALYGLSLVRDLTARAVLVEWELRLTPGAGQTWRRLSHLQPPTALYGPDDADDSLRTWRRGHYLCKCLWRQGPGFIQIRDRRWGELRRFTADEPGYDTAIGDLDYGALRSAVPAPILEEFRAEQLILETGAFAWWVPYRVNRWLQQSIAI